MMVTCFFLFCYFPLRLFYYFHLSSVSFSGNCQDFVAPYFFCILSAILTNVMDAVIIEDEPLAAIELEHVLQEIAPEVNIVACLDSVRESVTWLRENPVDLIFSDIHLGDGQSFDIFKQVDVGVPVVFITAYDEYALEAFKNQGVGYILKPFDKEEVKRVLERVVGWFGKEGAMPATKEAPVYQERFLVQIGARIKSVPAMEIAYFMADGKYLMLYTFEGAGYVADLTMAGVEMRLDPKLFFRISRKFIVNYRAIKDMIRYSNSRIKIILTPEVPAGVEAVVSSERIKEFKEWLNR